MNPPKCIIQECEVTAEGEGHNKKEAETAAAERVYVKLQAIIKQQKRPQLEVFLRYCTKLGK